MLNFAGELLSNSQGNVIPAMAIVFAVVSSLNSVGVSVYQEILFKVHFGLTTLHISICSSEFRREFPGPAVLALPVRDDGVQSCPRLDRPRPQPQHRLP